VGVAASAATITDATIDINGSYVLKDGKYRFAGDFVGDLLNNPKMDRLYEVGITLTLRGKTVLTHTLSPISISAAPFSVRDALKGDVKGTGFGGLLAGLDLGSKVNSGSTSASGDFKRSLGKGRSAALKALCKSIFVSNSSRKCNGPNDFGLTLVFAYDVLPAPLPGPESELPGQPAAQQPAPVPLPAGLPLLGAGIAALVALRRTRRA
jgi:hypothetical protein